ncbi:30S ribosomal protein S16, partial [Candidatus Margulisiibacteriota bacterium]
MAVRLRLVRFGKKKKPFYRLAAANNTSPRDGKVIEFIGIYDPLKDPIQFEFKEERVKHWLDNGALPTDTVSRLLEGVGICPKKERKSANQGISKKEREKAQEQEKEQEQEQKQEPK